MNKEISEKSENQLKERLAKELITAVVENRVPTPAACFEFCINDLRKYEALYYPIKNQEISLDHLTGIIGNGKKVTELVNACPSNPHKGIAFKTLYNYSYIMEIMDDLQKYFKK